MEAGVTTRTTAIAGSMTQAAGSNSFYWNAVDRMNEIDDVEEAVALIEQVGRAAGFGLPAFVEDVADSRCTTTIDGSRLLDRVGWPAWLTDVLGSLPFTHRHPVYAICRTHDAPFAMDEPKSWGLWPRLGMEQRHLRDAMTTMNVGGFACFPMHRAGGRVAALVWSGIDEYFCRAVLLRHGPALQAMASQFIDLLDRTPAIASNPPLPLLTMRQFDCLYHAARGLTAEETANALGVSPHTVRQHLKDVCEKVGARNISHAVALACCSGTISEVEPRGPIRQGSS